ncbi:glycosyltransferase [Achromobacter mucicolens]|uniref:glycosyltransferase n=1 Tax=Achromobacter mucicolens TaxID=1389922 RepID=UPI001CBE9FAE|nr:glycosyltransferase [Achromobacter mucicolens]MDH1524428.1 glycosyltransferase [Achromobacter mucicolens]UAN01203.1 glycosyltransferase [Achromobacter mucicolens]
MLNFDDFPASHARTGGPLRILHTEAATAFGGQEFCIYKEMVAMRERGHHLEAVCQPHAELAQRLRDAGFTVHTVNMDGAVNFVRSVAFVRRVAARGRFDVVNTHSRSDTVRAAMGARLARTPLIVRTRHLAKPINSLYAYTWLAHRVIAVSRHVHRQLLDGGAPPEAVATIHSPIVLPEGDGKGSLRQELGLPGDALVVGCVAVMRTEKGHADLIDAFQRVLAAFPQAHLVLAGDGMPVFERLKGQVQGLGLASRVHFLGRRNDIGNVLQAFDVFALPTHREAFGTAFVEAAAMGVPVIGTDVGGVPETMQAGVTGLLVPPRDPAALAAALESLLADPERRRRMGEAGRELIRGQGLFSVDRAAQLVEAAYARWLGERRGRAPAAPSGSMP